MSIKSYRKNDEKKVAGPRLPVCFPAALEQVSPNHSYRPQIYRTYKEFTEYLDGLSIVELSSKKVISECEDMADYLLRPLGGLLLNDIVMKTINTEIGLKRAMNAYSEDHRIVVDVKYGNNPNRSVHSVGVVPVDADNVFLVSTHIPSKIAGIITLSKLATSLARTEDNRVPEHPFATANFLAIPEV
jgi:hypothetical protein